jgi:hypothetical protein
LVQLVVAKDKFNETANAVSSRSRGGNKTLLKPKETDGAGAGAGAEKLFTEKIKRLFNILEDNNDSSTIARPNKLN